MTSNKSRGNLQYLQEIQVASWRIQASFKALHFNKEKKKSPTLKQNTQSHYLKLYILSSFLQFTVFKTGKSSESVIQEKSKYRLEPWNNHFKLILTFQSSLPPVTVLEDLTWQYPFLCLLLLQDMKLIFATSLQVIPVPAFHHNILKASWDYICLAEKYINTHKLLPDLFKLQCRMYLINTKCQNESV